jgi:hypothetical protein
MDKARQSDEYARFNSLVRGVLSVPPETIKRRLEEDREKPKPKKKKGKSKETPPR